MWRDGKIFYQLDVVGYPAAVAQAQIENPDAQFTLVFSDSSGFNLFDHSIPLISMIQTHGTSGTPAGWVWQGNEYLTADLYRNATTWNCVYQGIRILSDRSDTRPSSKPKPILQAKWKNRAAWRELRKGMSKDEVEEILGPPGKIFENYTSTTWYYGYPLGGEVGFLNDAVFNWSEP